MIILVYGLPGTGKSFFAQLLAKKLNAVHLSEDMIRDKLNAKGVNDESTQQQIYNELYKQIMIELREKHEVIVEGVFIKSIRREMVKNIAVEIDEPIYLIELRADESTVKKRLRKTRRHNNIGFEQYKLMEQEFEPESDHHLVLLTDEEPVEDRVARAIRFIKE